MASATPSRTDRKPFRTSVCKRSQLAFAFWPISRHGRLRIQSVVEYGPTRRLAGLRASVRDCSSDPNTTTDARTSLKRREKRNNSGPCSRRSSAKIGQQFPDDRRQLETVAGKAAGDGDVGMCRVTVDHEMAIRCQRVNAHGSSSRGPSASGRCRRTKSRTGASIPLEILRSTRPAGQFWRSIMPRDFDSMAVGRGNAVEAAVRQIGHEDGKVLGVKVRCVTRLEPKSDLPHDRKRSADFRE